MRPIKTVQDLKDELKKACQVYQLYPTPRPDGMHSCLAAGIPALIDPETVKYKPTPAEVDDADIVQFQWLPLLMPEDRLLIWKRFSGTGWKRLAFEIQISERTARNRVNAALKKLLTAIQS